VSRKYTSSVWTWVHFVRSRPAKYPPIAEAKTWVRISHTTAPFPTVEAEAPRFDHGDTEDNPSPVPKASRINARDAETKAPPMTAAQDMPDEDASFLTGTSASELCRSITGRGTADWLIFAPFALR
jgi:hypothetical protein